MSDETLSRPIGRLRRYHADCERTLRAEDFDTLPDFQTGDIQAKQRIWRRTGRLVAKLGETGAMAWTTYAVAEVKTQDGQRQTWIAAAGRKGDVDPRYPESGEQAIINKVPDGDRVNRRNDAEQTLLREAKARGADLLAVGASRLSCDRCRDAYRKAGLLEVLVTPLKHPIREHQP